MEEVLTRRFVHGMDEREERKQQLEDEFGSFTRDVYKRQHEEYWQAPLRYLT